RDNARLIATLKHLRDLGNSVIVVEHDEEAIRSADHVLDMGPGAGEAGGRVVAEGTLEDILASRDSLTGRYLARELSIDVPARRPPPRQRTRGASRPCGTCSRVYRKRASAATTPAASPST